MVGVMIALPVVVRPLASAIAAPLKRRGMPGELAKQNATRNPRRTAATAAALMIGLTLVVSMGVFASSLKASFGDVIAEQTNADLFVAPSSTSAPGFSPSVVDAVRMVAGVDAVSANGWGEARFEGEGSSFSSVDPSTADEVMNLHVSQGSIADLGDDGVLVAKSAATAHGWSVGDTVSAEFAASGKHRLHVVGIYDGKGWIGDDYILSVAEQNDFAGPQLVSAALVTVKDGFDKTAVQDDIATVLDDHPDAQVLDEKGFEKVAGGFIDGLLTFVTVMLALAVVIALLGIVNTLALSVFERTREARSPAGGRHDPRPGPRDGPLGVCGDLADRRRERCGPRHRHRPGALAGAEGRGDQGDLHPGGAGGGLCRARSSRGSGRRDRTGSVGRAGRRAQGGGDRLTGPSVCGSCACERAGGRAQPHDPFVRSEP